ncbi:MAG: hypothetical protein ABIG42_11920, partial [bacterium]
MCNRQMPGAAHNRVFEVVGESVAGLQLGQSRTRFLMNRENTKLIPPESAALKSKLSQWHLGARSSRRHSAADFQSASGSAVLRPTHS